MQSLHKGKGQYCCFRIKFFTQVTSEKCDRSPYANKILSWKFIQWSELKIVSNPTSLICLISTVPQMRLKTVMLWCHSTNTAFLTILLWICNTTFSFWIIRLSLHLHLHALGNKRDYLPAFNLIFILFPQNSTGRMRTTWWYCHEQRFPSQS